jgi:hypothetical protein
MYHQTQVNYKLLFLCLQCIPLPNFVLSHTTNTNMTISPFTAIRLDAGENQTGYVYVNATTDDLTLDSISGNINLDSTDVSFWTDAAKTTRMTFNALRTTVDQEVIDRIAAVAAGIATAEATAASELSDFVSATSTALTDLDTSLRSTISTINAKLGSDIAVGDALNASNLTAFETATASNFTDESNARTAADDALDARVANIEAQLAAMNSPPP